MSDRPFSERLRYLQHVRSIQSPTIRKPIFLVMPFGRHKGKSIRDVPTPYILWLLQQEWMLTGNLHTALEHELRARYWDGTL